MTMKNSTTTVQASAKNKTKTRGTQARDPKKETDEKSEASQESDTEVGMEANDGDQSASGGGSQLRSSKDDDAESGKSSSGSASLIMQIVKSFVGDNLQDALTSAKSKVSEQMEVHGGEYLDSAKTHLIEATDKVVAWGKKHPVQAVAAATALIGVSAFLYATLRKKGEPEGGKRGAKGSA